MVIKTRGVVVRARRDDVVDQQQGEHLAPRRLRAVIDARAAARAARERGTHRDTRTGHKSYECYARVEAPDWRFSYKRVSIFCPNITPKRLGY